MAYGRRRKRGCSRGFARSPAVASVLPPTTPAPATSLDAVAVRDGTTTVYVLFGARLFRSDDDGQSWRESGSAQGRVVVHAPSGWLFDATEYEGLRVSRDTGATWEILVDAQTHPGHPGTFSIRATPGWTWPVAFDAAGHLVTASPTAVVGPFARGLGAHAILGTELAYDAQDRVAGAFASLNCRGPEKVARLKRAFGEDVQVKAAYGDTGGDTEMLAMAEIPGFRVFTARP